jgi:hypothetical protein
MRRHLYPIITVVLLSSLVATLIVFLAGREKKKYKYEIVDGNRVHYYTTSYTKGQDGCITFQKFCQCGSDELETVVLCGTYTIEENKKYDPTKN